jgi:teichuronic acid biosynthesis glycosyltransferase TuaC
MRIAFLCKRQYMGKDVIIDRYGRLYEFPRQLGHLGHDVRCFCLSYQGQENGEWTHESIPCAGRLHWESHTLGPFLLPGLARYPLHVLRSLRRFRPDVLIGASDIPHAVLTQWLAKRLKIPYAIDLYDNFEGFGQARFPGMVAALRRAVRKAALVTTTSELLKELVEGSYHPTGKVLALPSTIDKSVFYPQVKAFCRQALDLPAGAPLVGTAGGLLRTRGIGVLYDAWSQIAAKHPDARLVLAGPIDRHYPPPERDDVVYLGNLTHRQTALLFNALDVGVIYLRDTPFGRYCFPQKAYEMIACRLPIAAADIGAMPTLFSNPCNLYRADDSASLAQTIISNIDEPAVPDQAIRDWHEIVSELDRHLRNIFKTNKRGAECKR